MSRARTPKDPRLPLTTRVIDEEPTAAVVPDELESRVYRECSPASAGASQDIRPDIVPFSVTLWLLLFWRCSPDRCYAGHFKCRTRSSGARTGRRLHGARSPSPRDGHHGRPRSSG